MEQIAENRIFSGQQLQFKHQSTSLNCQMQFSVYLPPQSDGGNKVPVMVWLSGLTCNDQNFVTKAGAQQAAAEHGIAIVCPDTSPRGDGVADDAEGAWDFGLGAGFYVNATEQPWAQHYQMYDYVVNELPALLDGSLPLDLGNTCISGHSMGGHGALTIALNNPDKYKSVSAFSPIVSPINCPWGQKALSNYIGSNRADWERYDTCSLVGKAQRQMPVLVDQGSADNFLEEQLKTDLLIEAAAQADYPMQIRYQDGYDHSYYFIATFIAEHLAFHRQHLS